eukprot:2309311-Ditylum_brightwellii.AAC.1
MDVYSAEQKPPIKMNYAAEQEHVPQAERNNHTIEECMRCEYQRSPFDHIPMIMLKYMVSKQT